MGKGPCFSARLMRRGPCFTARQGQPCAGRVMTKSIQTGLGLDRLLFISSACMSRCSWAQDTRTCSRGIRSTNPTPHHPLGCSSHEETQSTLELPLPELPRVCKVVVAGSLMAPAGSLVASRHGCGAGSSMASKAPAGSLVATSL